MQWQNELIAGGAQYRLMVTEGTERGGRAEMRTCLKFGESDSGVSWVLLEGSFPNNRQHSLWHLSGASAYTPTHLHASFHW